MKREDFLKGIENWDDHRLLLWEALELTKESKFPIAEFGAGMGSTSYLREYSLDNERDFLSYENNREWADKCSSLYVHDWNDPALYRRYSVVLIDHAPGEHRHEAIAMFKDLAEIIVVHDSEKEASGYMLWKIFPLFAYRVDCRGMSQKGAEASALSNKIDLRVLAGITFGDFKIEL